MEPKISIITPSLNQGKYIEDTIRSIVDQPYKNKEYIIIDGGSTDQTLDIIKKYENSIDYWISESDNGQAHAINKGFQKATGDILTWINSDDTLQEDVFGRVASYFNANPGIKLIHGKTVLINSNGKEIVRGADEDLLPHAYLSGMTFSQPSSFFRAEVLEEQGLLDESLHYGMDYDLLVRIALNYEIMSVSDIFSKYLLHEESKTSTSSEKFARDWAKVFSKVLRSVPNTKAIIEILKEVGLYLEGTDHYTVSKEFDEQFLKVALGTFIYFQLIFYYEAGLTDQTEQLAGFLKERYPDLYKKKNIRPVYWRSRWLSNEMLRAFRRIRMR